MQILKKFSQLARHYTFALAVVPLGSVLVTWNASPDADVKGYRVYYGNASQQYFKMIDVGNVTEYSVGELQEDTPYYFAVTAYDTAGNESAFSEEAYIMLHGTDPPPPKPQDGIVQSYNFPNPFVPAEQTTRLRYFLEQAGPVTVQIYDLNNNLVRTLLDATQKSAGEHLEDVWDGRDRSGNIVANGVYYCRIETEQYTHFLKIAVRNKTGTE